MKNVLLISLLLFFNSVSAQTQFSVGLENSVNAIFGTYRGITSPQISWKQSNKEFSVGPAILVATEIAASDKSFPKLVGLQFNYKTYPSFSTKKINFYLYNDLTAMRIVDRWEAAVWSEEVADYQAYKYSSTEIIIQNHFGYGIELQLFNKLMLTQAVGLGGYFSLFDGNEDSDNAPSLENEDVNINGYSPVGFSYQIKLGLRWKL